ncbi:MAG: hypothetical protein L6R45_05270 [Anaerolineae bacterium]|nr:hypothetical protein [Anaerolineae bacterium]
MNITSFDAFFPFLLISLLTACNSATPTPSPLIASSAIPSTSTPATTPVETSITSTIQADKSVGEISLGYLAFIRSGDLWIKTVPNGSDMQLTQDGQNYYPSWSYLADFLLVWKGEQESIQFNNSTQPWIIRRDGTESFPATENAVSVAVWSPVSNTLAYGTDQGIWVLDVNTKKSDQLIAFSSDERLNEYPVGLVWSSDGQWLYFTRQQVEPEYDYQGLWRVNLSNKNSSEVFSFPNPQENQVRLASISPDGTQVVFWRGEYNSESIAADGLSLEGITIITQTRQTLLDSMLNYPEFLTWSPNGHRLLVVSGNNRYTWTNKQLVLIDEQGQSINLSNPNQADILPTWSPDAQKIAYVSAPDEAKEDNMGDEALTKRRIWTMFSDGSNKQQFTNDPTYRDERPLWSSDGQRILFVRMKQDQAEIWIMQADGSKQQKVVSDLLIGADGRVNEFFGRIDWRKWFDWWR